eukprot:Nk52_evm43s352 gene=Nk52_evmTU43s352
MSFHSKKRGSLYSVTASELAGVSEISANRGFQTSKNTLVRGSLLVKKDKDSIESESLSLEIDSEEMLRIESKRNFRILVILVLFGFLKAFKPSEAFLYPYLSDTKGFTDDEINNQIFTVLTYSYLISLVMVAVLTKYIGYKIVIFIEAAAQLATRIILVWGNSLFLMQLMQVTFGIACAGEIAYFAYVYTLVDEKFYQKLTSFTRAAVLVGHMSASILGQILVTNFNVEYTVLFYISLASVTCATLTVFFFPRKHEDYEEVDGLVLEDVGSREETSAPEEKESVVEWAKNSLVRIKIAYENYTVIRYSVWWIFAWTNVYNMEGYGSSLWDYVDSSVVWNGYVDAMSRGCSALAAFVPLLMLLSLRKYGEVVIVFVSSIMTAVSYLMTYSTNIYLTYGLYIAYCACGYFIVAMAASKIAEHMLGSDDYSFVFGWNAFFSVLIQTIMQLVMGHQGLSVLITTRFFVFSTFAAWAGSSNSYPEAYVVALPAVYIPYLVFYLSSVYLFSLLLAFARSSPENIPVELEHHNRCKRSPGWREL